MVLFDSEFIDGGDICEGQTERETEGVQSLGEFCAITCNKLHWFRELLAIWDRWVDKNDKIRMGGNIF